jgi:hypothetical protein
MNAGDSESPERCDQCERQFSGLTRVYLLGVAVTDV